MADLYNPLDSLSNNVWEKFVNIMKFTEAYGQYGGKTVNEKNAIIFRGDVVVNENFSMASEISSHPVYKSSDITDQARPSDFIVSVTGVSSDASMSYLDSVSSAVNSNIGNIVRGFLNGDDASDAYLSKSQAVFKQLKKWWENGTPLTIDCAFDVGGLTDQDMNKATFIIQNLSIPRSAEIGSRAIKFNMSLKMIRFAKVEKTNISLYSYNRGTKGSVEPGGGASGGAAIKDKAQEAPESLLDQKKNNPRVRIYQ